MFKKFIILIIISVFLYNCSSTIKEFNERAKGDGVPYLPGL